MVEIEELAGGLRVRSFSHVGRVRLGDIIIVTEAQLERIGAGAARLIVKNDSAAAADAQRATIELGAVDRKSAGDQLLKFLEARAEFASVRAVAHRVCRVPDAPAWPLA